MVRLLALGAVLWVNALFAAEVPFVISCVDEQTGRGIPLVELRTSNDVLFVSDNAGLVAVTDPDLLGRKVYFGVHSHGYSFPKDGFGSTGKALEVAPGGTATLKLKRVNIAERLYRVTGGGQYRDSVLAGKRVPVTEPLLNGEVTGQDSAQTAVYGGKMYWFWGDTNRLSYILGHFGTSGATSQLPESGGLDPYIGVNLTYFKNADGFSRKMIGGDEPGLKWIDGLCVVKDGEGREHMAGRCTRLKKLGEIYDTRLVVFNDKTELFESVCLFDGARPLAPDGYAFVHEGYAYFCAPFPAVRVAATFDAMKDQRQYEAFTCLKAGATAAEKPEIDRDAQGNAVWAWKRDTAGLTPAKQNDLVKKGVLKREETRGLLTDAGGQSTVVPHTFGSVAWNAFRKKWIALILQMDGSSSYLGEVWYCEADATQGPWSSAKKVVTHDRYSFYNIRQHPHFDQDGGRVIYFEGTYTAEFSGNPEKTPRYNYNQIMYRLDLNDPRLK